MAGQGQSKHFIQPHGKYNALKTQRIESLVDPALAAFVVSGSLQLVTLLLSETLVTTCAVTYLMHIQLLLLLLYFVTVDFAEKPVLSRPKCW